MDTSIDLIPVRSGFDGKWFWGQARAGAIPGVDGGNPTVVLTAQPALRSGSDVYYALSEWRTSDFGTSWEGPRAHEETLGRRREEDGVEVAICDMEPEWHAGSGRLLSTGHSVGYRNDAEPMIARRREPVYSVYDKATATWTPWDIVSLPEVPEFENAGAGSAQRFDLEDGTILLPIYHKPISEDWHASNFSTVLRCSFDGEKLSYLEHGNSLSAPDPRGMCEPSLTRVGSMFYLTLRNDVRGYVATSEDGLHFGEPVPWRFDDGSELGNYNTQQHWITHGGRLFLVYTRKGLNNDHVFRHRAPLVMAEVDPERLVVIRTSEREVIPNRGARLGNFSVCPVTESETWVVVAEWMQPEGCEAYGCNNTIWAARIRWVD